MKSPDVGSKSTETENIMKHFYLIVIFYAFLSCKQEKPNITTDDSFRKIQTDKGWKSYKDEKVNVLLPPNWKPEIESDLILFVPIDRRENLFYAVLEHNIAEVGSLKSYVKEAFKQVSESHKDLRYTIDRVVFTNNKVCYILTLYITENGHLYKLYNALYQSKDKIYDFTFRTINNLETDKTNYETFIGVMFTLKYNNTNVVKGGSDILKEAKTIKYEEL